MKKHHFSLVFVGVLSITVLFVMAGCQSVNPSNTLGETFTNLSLSTITEASDGDMQMAVHIGEAKQLLGFIKRDICELEKSSIAIVKATVLDTKLNPDLPKESAIRLTDIRIDEVLKTDGNCNLEDTKVLVEYYNTEIYPDEPNVIHVFSSNKAKPLQKKQMYLLFLEKSPHEFGDYIVTGGFQGQYPITEKTSAETFSSLTADDLDFMPEVVNETLWQLVEQVLDKYMKN